MTYQLQTVWILLFVSIICIEKFPYHCEAKSSGSSRGGGSSGGGSRSSSSSSSFGGSGKSTSSSSSSITGSGSSTSRSRSSTSSTNNNFPTSGSTRPHFVSGLGFRRYPGFPGRRVRPRRRTESCKTITTTSITTTTTTIPVENSCTLYTKTTTTTNDNNDNSEVVLKEEKGVSVCRQLFSPISGKSHKRSACLPDDQTWETDDCGCCNDVCPTYPSEYLGFCPTSSDTTTTEVFADFQLSAEHMMAARTTQSIQTTNITNTTTNTNEELAETLSVIVCRILFDPYTGNEKRVTIPIWKSRGMPGDTCGCCSTDVGNGNNEDGAVTIATEDSLACSGLPLIGFPRPETFISCTATAHLSCGGSSNHIFVCRTFFNPLTGESESGSLCINSQTEAWDTDRCGCCDIEEEGVTGGDTNGNNGANAAGSGVVSVTTDRSKCPLEPPESSAVCDTDTSENNDTKNQCFVKKSPSTIGSSGGGDIEDDEEEEIVEGTFVCRSLFHPIDGQVRFRTLCVEDTWVSDSCGCCNGRCPAPLQRGDDGKPAAFEVEAVQLLMLALEDPLGLEIPEYESGGSLSRYNTNNHSFKMWGILSSFVMTFVLGMII